MRKLYVFFLLTTFLISSCQNKGLVETYKPVRYNLEFNGLPRPSIPKDNQLTEEGVELGRRLFYETALSKDNSISCASCHRQENAFSDPRKFSEGVRKLKGKRQAMAIFNMLWNTNEFFWDGRAHLLRDQSLLPIQDTLEMDETLERVVAKLQTLKDYKERFKRAFPNKEISEVTISLALEQFMNSIVSNRSKFDKNNEGKAFFTASEERGKEIFFGGFRSGKGANCAQCHGEANFENDDYMNNGLDLDRDLKDLGRDAVKRGFLTKGAFKVPSLRNIAVTAPYMHDGRFKTLDEVIEHYNSGVKSDRNTNVTLSIIAKSGGLQLSNQDKIDLKAFLLTLTDEDLLKDSRYSNPFE
ncbi:cytochrome C peroxidase [Tenacibaculum holothuriorum]|uniref:Cytochrome C peroxidase n=1 Tax=Tenacibaculum holothuriorum TaxID=1635173 RepID=A0A1Y2PEB3_9FLAO|nr:cytochrome c peroxidase [Tenacibaculum holothuriorum]OSY88812.1 cytochrome C peroxidase [Tenacibaculum holothuriorum]